MTDVQKTWLDELYDKEILETHKSIDNERVWAAGSSCLSAEKVHLDNIVELESYIEELENLKDNIQTL